jgi:hypothetical protein
MSHQSACTVVVPMSRRLPCGKLGPSQPTTVLYCTALYYSLSVMLWSKLVLYHAGIPYPVLGSVLSSPITMAIPWGAQTYGMIIFHKNGLFCCLGVVCRGATPISWPKGYVSAPHPSLYCLLGELYYDYHSHDISIALQ